MVNHLKSDILTGFIPDRNIRNKMDLKDNYGKTAKKTK